MLRENRTGEGKVYDLDEGIYLYKLNGFYGISSNSYI